MAEYGVIEKVLSVVDVSPAGAVRGHISPSAFFLLLSTVTTCARASPSLAHRLLDGGMHASVKSLLENSDSAAGSVRSTAVIKTQQQLLQVSAPYPCTHGHCIPHQLRNTKVPVCFEGAMTTAHVCTSLVSLCSLVTSQADVCSCVSGVHASQVFSEHCMSRLHACRFYSF